jgi:hypothetical protein
MSKDIHLGTGPEKLGKKIESKKGESMYLTIDTNEFKGFFERIDQQKKEFPLICGFLKETNDETFFSFPVNNFDKLIREFNLLIKKDFSQNLKLLFRRLIKICKIGIRENKALSIQVYPNSRESFIDLSFHLRPYEDNLLRLEDEFLEEAYVVLEPKKEKYLAIRDIIKEFYSRDIFSVSARNLNGLVIELEKMVKNESISNDSKSLILELIKICKRGIKENKALVAISD